MMNLRTDVQMTSITIVVFFIIQKKQNPYGVSILLRYGAPLAGFNFEPKSSPANKSFSTNLV